MGTTGVDHDGSVPEYPAAVSVGLGFRADFPQPQALAFRNTPRRGDVLKTENMLKPTVTYLFALLSAILLGAHCCTSDRKDPTLWAAAVFAMAATVTAGITLWDRWKSNSARRKKWLRGDPEDFKANLHDGLTSLEIILSKSELTYDRIYELSQHTRVMTLLIEHELSGLRDELGKFADLHQSGRKRSSIGEALSCDP
jgi:hypothetical protein